MRSLLRFRPLAQLQWIPWGVRLASKQPPEDKDAFDFLNLAVTEFGAYHHYLAEMQRDDPSFFNEFARESDASSLGES